MKPLTRGKNAVKTQVVSMYALSFLAYIGALISNSLLIVSLFRQKASYFKDVKRYFVATYLAFVVLILSGAFMRWFPSEATVLYASKIGVSACVSAAATIGLSAAILYKRVKLGPRKAFHTRDALKSPFALIHHGFLLAVLILTWALTPFKIEQMIGLISGELIYIPEYELWYAICLLLVVVSLFAYPCLLLFLLSRRAKAGKAVRALMGFGVCWASVGVSTFSFNIILRPMGFDAVWLGYLISTVFFGIIVHLFRETTVLESLLEEIYPPVGLVREGEVAVMLYTSAVDKMKVFSAFIREGLESGDMVDYIYPDEESETVRAKLREYGINVEKYERKGALRLRSLTEYYLPDGNFDKERAIKKGLDERAEAKRMGYKHARGLIDVGDFSFLNGQWQIFYDYWDDPRWGALPGAGILYEPFIIELTVFNVEGMSKEQVADLVKAFCGEGRVHLIDLIEHADTFSKPLGLDHKQLVGRKLLFEFDPASAYEKAIEDLVKESLANVEPILIFTPRGSVVHTTLAKQPVKFFLTSRTSVPEILSEKEVLLPANNPPLILDSFDRMLKAHPHGGVCLVFDIFSELLTSVGFEKTYKFVQYALEMLYSERVTAVFLLNSTAHDPKIVSSLRGLFANRIAYRKEGMQALRLPKAE